MPILTVCGNCKREQYIPFGIAEEYEAKKQGRDPNICKYCGEPLSSPMRALKKLAKAFFKRKEDD
jgi:hypothetical protein